MTTPLDAQVSVFAGVHKTSPVEQLPLGAMLARIQDGTYQPEIDALRALRTQDQAAYKTKKTVLYGFTPGCALHTRAAKVAWKDKLIAPSQIIHLDVDDVDAFALKARLIMEPSVVFAFISPSGAGLKLGIASAGIVDTTTYNQIWRATIEAWKTRFPDAQFKEDEHVKFLHALCFVSHDPELYVNAGAVPFLLPPPSSSSAAPPPPSSSSSLPDKGGRKEGRSLKGGRREGGEEQARVEDALQVIPADDYDTWLRVGMALHASGEAWARAVWDTWSQRSDKYDAAVQDEKWESFTPDRGVNLGTVFHLAQQHGYVPPKPRMMVGQHHPGAPPVPVDMTPWPGASAGVTSPDQAANATAAAAQWGTPAATVNLLLTKDNRPRGALANVLTVLVDDPRWKDVLGYNALSDEVTFLRCPPCYQEDPWKARPLEDHDDTEIAAWVQRQHAVFTATSTVHDALQAAAQRHAYHPIRTYLEGLSWDQTPRLDTWLPTYCGVADTPYTRAVGRTTLIGAVARVERPGSKVDTAPVLIGPQGIGKSTTWRVLCGDEWFSDTLPDLHDKDAMQALRGKWIIELGELATLHRSEVEVIKRYLSATQDHYRPSYGRRARTFLRQNIFVGTTNKEDIFKDETGNRRFYPITTMGRCDTDALTSARDQLWAEALHRYRQGEAWHLDAAMTAHAAKVQAEHMEHDPWEESVLEYAASFVGTIKITTTEVMQQAFRWENPALWTPAACKRIGAILRKDSWRPVKRYAHEATPTLPATTPDPKAPRRRVAAFEKAPSPLRDTDDTDDQAGNYPSVSPNDPHEIRLGTDDTDDTDTFSYARTSAWTAQKTHIPPPCFSNTVDPSVQSVSSVSDRINTSENGLWPICVICVTAHNPADICVTAHPSLPAAGDLVIPLTADGSQIPDNGMPFPWLIVRIEDGPDGQQYALFAESNTGWLLAQCQPAPVGHMTDIDIEEDA